MQMHTGASTRIPLKTGPEVRDEFARRGLSISEWARRHGFSAQLVYQVLAGRKRCLRGQSHQIAVRLRLKAGLIGSAEEIDDLYSGVSEAGAIVEEKAPMS